MTDTLASARSTTQGQLSTTTQTLWFTQYGRGCTVIVLCVSSHSRRVDVDVDDDVTSQERQLRTCD